MKFTFSIHIGAQPHYCFAQHLRLYLPWNSGAEQLGLGIYKAHKVQSISYLALCRTVLTSHLLYKGLRHKKTMRPNKISRRRRFFFNIFLLILFYSFILIYILYTFSISPRVCSSSCPLSQWCYLITSSSAALFSLCLQSFPASGSFPMSRLFASEIFIISSEITYLVRDNLLQYH